MADVHDKQTRSFNMSRIKGKDTKPEMLVRKYLFSKGFRYKLHDKLLAGKPDMVFPKYKTVIFWALYFFLYLRTLSGLRGAIHTDLSTASVENSSQLNKIKRSKPRHEIDACRKGQ